MKSREVTAIVSFKVIQGHQSKACMRLLITE